MLTGRGMDAFGDQELSLFVEPTVVVLDDLQWAPPDRIAELLRRPPRGSVLVALGFARYRRTSTLRSRLPAAMAS